MEERFLMKSSLCGIRKSSMRNSTQSLELSRSCPRESDAARHLNHNVRNLGIFAHKSILSGAGVDEVVSGTRLIKPGLDAVFATVLELEWATFDVQRPLKIPLVFESG